MRWHIIVCMNIFLGTLIAFSGGPFAARAEKVASPPQSDNERIHGLIREPLSLLVILQDGRRAKLDAFVTRPAKPGNWPIALLTNGADGNVQADRINLNPNRFSSPAIAFARHGYAAVSVLRQGFGRSTGQPDYEGNSCEKPRHKRAGEIARADIIAALNAIRRQPWASEDKAVLIGLSAGGFGVIAASAENPVGVQAVISFDGGRGARGLDESICGRDELLSLMKHYGTSARLPTLWVYAANDRSFNPELGKEMFGLYRGAGGIAEFYEAPAFQQNGHSFIVSASEDFWWPRIAQFLKRNALPFSEIVGLRKTDLPMPKGLSSSGRQAFREYQERQTYEKAFATNGKGAWGWSIWARTNNAAAEQAITLCRRSRPENMADCALYAIGNRLAGKR